MHSLTHSLLSFPHPRSLTWEEHSRHHAGEDEDEEREDLAVAGQYGPCLGVTVVLARQRPLDNHLDTEGDRLAYVLYSDGPVGKPYSTQYREAWIHGIVEISCV